MGKEAKKQSEAASDDDNDWIWAIVALAALSIPILAVAGDSIMIYAIAASVVIASVAAAAWFLMNHRHKLRLQELQAQADATRLDTANLEQTNRILEQNAELAELRQALRTRQPDPLGPSGIRQTND